MFGPLANKVDVEQWAHEEMRKGASSARQALVLAGVLLLGTGAVANVQAVRDDPRFLLLILLAIGIGYCAQLLQFQRQWRFAKTAITGEGILAPTRSFVAAFRGEPGRLIRFEDVARVVIQRAEEGEGRRVLVLQTNKGRVHYFHEWKAPGVCAELAQRFG